MRLCFVLGQRPKEIAHMRKSKLPLDSLYPALTIEKVTAKNRTTHMLPLPKIALGLIQEAMAFAPKSEWLFPRPDGKGPIDPHSFAKIIERIRRRQGGTVFGLRDAHLYDAKKTIATFLGDAGYPDQFIGLLFNHLTAKTGTVTGRHYNHSRYMTQKREMIERWARHLEIILDLTAATDTPNVVQYVPLHG
jgi:integrase